MGASWESQFHLMFLGKIVSRHKSLAAAGEAWGRYLKKHGASMRPELRGHPNLWVNDFGLENGQDVTSMALEQAESSYKAKWAK
jgi:hypothetical protein